MFFGFNRAKQRQPADVARSLKDLLVRLWESPMTPKVSRPSSNCRFFEFFSLNSQLNAARRRPYKADMSSKSDRSGVARQVTDCGGVWSLKTLLTALC